MSTFDGLIREFPTVAIDNFKRRPGVHVYLLSHVHSDHLSGLAVKSWDSIIYCSQITAKWLPMLATRSRQIAFENGQDRVLQRKYAHLEPYLRPLATDTAHYLDVGGGRKARLSLIPAHHCPGAVMFLLQDDRSCILYTGDARNEAVDLRALGSMPIFSSSTQRIDRLYLDTTLCHQAFQEVPSRDSVISDLITFINRRPRLAHYYIDAWTFGYEDIWIGLAQAFHTKIHVSPYLYRLYEAIDGLIYPRVTPHLTMDGTSARFHSCRLGRTCGYGGAGGEHSSARELIRIQPNVAWFSPILNKERQKDDDLCYVCLLHFKWFVFLKGSLC
ncbi:beta-lactamase-like protein [Mortierella sp. GBAus27b]|nr:beta-lactamase-like protein [Mortierella sp. GBAus27b]